MRRFLICGTTFVLACLAATLIFLYYDYATVARQSNDLRLTLRFSATTLHVGEEVNFTATITNTGNQNVRLVLPGDGSGQGLRTPDVSMFVARNDDAARPPSYPERFLGCGTIRALTTEEIFTLAPGGSKSLGEDLSRQFNEPGVYRVALLYANSPSLGWQGRRVISPMATFGVKSSTECNLISNEVLITVEE